MNYLYVDIETVPVDKEKHLSLDEEERKKLLNPIDSKIIAIGLKSTKDNKLVILQSDNEKEMLTEFWKIYDNFRANSSLTNKIVGFNIKQFDISFLVTRSFVNGVTVVPFVLKEIIDIRDLLTCFKRGPTRGTLKEFGEIIGVVLVEDMDGSKVAETYWSGNIDLIKTYLAKDIELTEKIHNKVMELGLDKIREW
ncbi:MAG: ribonuclease H-like domain-containing protein [archaeon]|jgi:uncharacterized protein YprB with RNaseH-like and TPR domain